MLQKELKASWGMYLSSNSTKKKKKTLGQSYYLIMIANTTLDQGLLDMLPRLGALLTRNAETEVEAFPNAQKQVANECDDILAP